MFALSRYRRQTSPAQTQHRNPTIANTFLRYTTYLLYLTSPIVSSIPNFAKHLCNAHFYLLCLNVLNIYSIIIFVVLVTQVLSCLLWGQVNVCAIKIRLRKSIRKTKVRSNKRSIILLSNGRSFLSEVKAKCIKRYNKRYINTSEKNDFKQRNSNTELQ